MLNQTRDKVIDEIKTLLPWVEVQAGYINIKRDLPLM